MYPEMEVAEETHSTSLAEDSNTEIKKEATNSQNADSSDHHPLREIASVMMTSAGMEITKLYLKNFVKLTFNFYFTQVLFRQPERVECLNREHRPSVD